jgi:hypothetical protein
VPDLDRCLLRPTSQTPNFGCCLFRWDQCWIRLLDGMLQLSVAGTRDYELRIPTRIRSILINCAAGTPDGQIYVRVPSSL